MPIKDIVVHLDATRQTAARTKAAIQIATQHDAHVTGVYVIPEPFIPLYDATQIPVEIYEQEEENQRQKAEQARGAFETVFKGTDVAHEFRSEQGPAVDVMVKHARYCDLLVTGQRDPDESDNGADIPDGLILSVGRPVLVIPYISREIGDIGNHVMVAWDASAPSTRAVHDAMPLMKSADRVDVIAINPRIDAGGHGEIPCADISLHLARHGLDVAAQSINVDDIGVADMLLSRIADQSVDLFVMGAYGHSRWRELVLGGVTAHMLDHMTVPVLMSH